jgi:hypothetical protein
MRRRLAAILAALMAGYSRLTAEFCNGCEIAKATHEHCCHPRKQHGTDLEAGKPEHTANARQYRDDAQKHADGTANPANPQQKDCHA